MKLHFQNKITINSKVILLNRKFTATMTPNLTSNSTEPWLVAGDPLRSGNKQPSIKDFNNKIRGRLQNQ